MLAVKRFLGAMLFVSQDGVEDGEGRCHGVGGLVAEEHAENQLLRISVPSGDHSPGDLALSPVHPQTLVGALSAEAVRKRDFQEPMRERHGALQVSQRLRFSSREELRRPIAWMSGCAPRMAIIRFKL